MQQAQTVRRALYVLFARLLAGPPDAALYERMRDGGLKDLAQLQGVELTGDLLDQRDAESSASELAAEYARLRDLASLRASDYTGGSRDPVVAIDAYVKEQRLELDNGFDLPLDHLAYALGIMGELAGAAEGGDRQAEQRARAFFLRHVSPWAQQALTELSARADRHFYRGLSAMVSAFLGSELRQYRTA